MQEGILLISDLSRMNSFCKDAMLDSHRAAWKKRREDGDSYANILITSKGHSFGNHWTTWWEPYIGMEFFARIEYKENNGVLILKEAYPVRLTSSLIHEGRGIPASAFNIA